jgi:hypothetical protein
MTSQNAVQQVKVKGFADIPVKPELTVLFLYIGVATDGKYRQMRVFCFDFHTDGNTVLPAYFKVKHHDVWPQLIDHFQNVIVTMLHSTNLETFHLQCKC